MGFFPFATPVPSGPAGGVLSGTYPNPGLASPLTIPAALTVTGIETLNAGTTTAGSAPVLTALGAVSGTSIQLTDATRDYMVYLEVTTAGTATVLSMGHTNAASDVTLLTSIAVAAGDLFAFRLPAAWWFKWTGVTTAIGNQNAVGC